MSTLLDRAKAHKREELRREAIPSREEIELALALLNSEISDTQLLAALEKPVHQRTGAAFWCWGTLKRANISGLITITVKEDS